MALGEQKIDIIFLGKLLGLTSGLLFLPIEIKVGVVLRPFDFFLFLAILVGTVTVNRKSMLKGFISQRLGLAYILLAGYIVVNAFFLNPSSFVKEAIQQVEFVLYFYMVFCVFSQEDSRKAFLESFFFSMVVMVSYTVLWHVSHGYIVRYKRLHEPKYMFGMLSAVLFLKMFFYRRLTIPFLLSVVFLIFSLERKAWVSFLLGMVASSYYLFRYFGYRMRVSKIYGTMAVTGLVLGTIVVAGLFAGAEELNDQFADTGLAVTKFSLENRDSEEVGSQSNATRMYLLYFSLQSIKQNPIFGIGTDRFKEENEKIAFSLGEKKAHGSHNEYQRIAVENGVPAVLIYLGIYFFSYFRMRNSGRRSFFKDEGHVITYLTIVSLLIYGAVINFFLGGGAINKFYLAFPVGMVIGYCWEQKKARRLALAI